MFPYAVKKPRDFNREARAHGRKIIPEEKWREFIAAYETSAIAAVRHFLTARLPVASTVALRLEASLRTGLAVRGDPDVGFLRGTSVDFTVSGNF